MVTALASIAPLTATATGVDAQQLLGLLWAHATPDDHIEHIRIRAGPHGLDILAFVDMADPQRAYRTLHLLTHKTIITEPRLRMWRLV